MTELGDCDLERIAAGKGGLRGTLSRANRAFDAHADAMRTLEQKGSELLDNGNRLFKER